MEYKILRPPLAKSFELPSRDELLKLNVGDHVKLRFQVGDDSPERMWVVVEHLSNPEEWSGMIDNDATQPVTAKSLPAGTLVKFHPLDIVLVE